MAETQPKQLETATEIINADLNIQTDGMEPETITETNEALPENHPLRWENIAQEMGLIQPRSALLWSCPKCDSWNISEHKNTTINRTLSLGSRKAKLTVNPNRACASCGAHGMRLHSEYRTRVIAQVDASKRKQVKNLQAVAEELNALQEDTGEMATEHDANKAWFSMNKLLKQGKGRKWWGMPFRRWQTTLSKRRCQ